MADRAVDLLLDRLGNLHQPPQLRTSPHRLLDIETLDGPDLSNEVAKASSDSQQDLTVPMRNPRRMLAGKP
jgi:hypothetical protein